MRWVLLLALVGGCASGPTGGEGTRVLRLGHGLSTDHPVHLAMTAMAAHVDSASGGSLQLAIYPSGQLGSERECLELLQIGSLAMTKVSASVLEGFAPEFAVFSLPYLFRDEAHRLAFFHSDVGADVLDSTEPFRFRGLTYYDAGARSYYTVERPVRTPDDLRGLKIRVQESPTSMRMVRAMGGSPTPISWGELYTALQQGVVDGAENNPPSYHLSRHYEVAPYFVLNEHTAVPDVLVIGAPIWDELSEQEKRWVEEAAEASARLEERLWRASTAEALAAVREAGAEVIEMSAEDRVPFSDLVAAMLTEVDAPTRALIEEIQAVESRPAPPASPEAE
ncbi:TRAP transporter substrate-binding protein [Rubrivirga sp. S365]|uniref:TRAP transporter substrate-binding protein n=1 Tax=Rubrivirga litoralis TaxID=3075598 RepID=A0ABU3BNP1_9BACT|nr:MULTISPECIES: TRAP transporter substrate-binding protein [unclassified Rubrivirga]MDT0630904.1 TRAP transporter substrate-binding protein [Rubrivirga sp. F394]MDT7856547.1 TRAP transporter substrate-binding protein [Rubrivirga sp. S365]